MHVKEGDAKSSIEKVRRVVIQLEERNSGSDLIRSTPDMELERGQGNIDFDLVEKHKRFKSNLKGR